jgi:hypothetical protein
LSFGGGGGGSLKAHTHDPAVSQDGGSLAATATSFSLSNGSILYSDGTNIQELAAGAEGYNLQMGSSVPEWVCPCELVIDQPLSSAGTEEVFGDSGTGKIRYGMRVTAGSNMIGETCVKIGVRLKKTGSPTGNITFMVANNAGTIQETLGTLDITTLTTSYVWYYVEKLDASYTVATNDRIGVRYSGGDSSNSGHFEWYDADSIANAEKYVYISSYDDQSARESQIKIYKAA